MRYCTLNFVEVIFALKQCDACVNLGISAKPEMMVHIPRFWRYQPFFHIIQIHLKMNYIPIYQLNKSFSMENLQFCGTSYMRIKVTSSTLACTVSTITWAKSSFQRLKMRFCTLNIVEVIFALKQCDNCVILEMSAKPEMMVHIQRFQRYQSFFHIIQNHL